MVDTNDDISRQEIVANVLHILSSQTKTIPATCRCTWGNNYATIDNTKHESDVSWDPFKSLLSDDDNTLHDDGDDETHINFPWYWLDAFASQCKIMSRGARNTSNNARNEEKLMQIKSVFIDSTNQLNKVMLNDDSPDDDLLWQVGIDLLKTHLFGKSDMDEDNTIPPHELLRVVMDSYYCNDNEDFDNMILSGVEMPTKEDEDVYVVEMPQEQMYRIPTSIGMFYLRSVLMCLALQNAKQSIINSQKSSKPIRWRRLRSMVDDSISLFQRMLFDYVGKAVDNFEHGRHPKSMKLYPIEPIHIIELSSWLYTQHVFPSCKDLLLKILFNEASGSNKGTSSEVKVLESCYNSFRMLTTLLAMDVTLVNVKPSFSVKLILKCIENHDKSQFFNQVRLAQKRITPKDTSDEDLSHDESVKNDMYQPWSDRGDNFQVIGLSLEEDLLLQPLIRKRHENSDRSSGNTFFDEIGIALIAYWKLCKQPQSSQETDIDLL